MGPREELDRRGRKARKAARSVAGGPERRGGVGRGAWMLALVALLGLTGLGVGDAVLAQSAPEHGPAGEGQGVRFEMEPQECFLEYAANQAACREIHCESYWFWTSCNQPALSLCLLGAKQTFDACIAQFQAQGG